MSRERKRFLAEQFDPSDRDDDGNRLCTKCDGVLSDEPIWEARVCGKCQNKARVEAVERFHERNPGYGSAAVQRTRQQQKGKKVRWLLARWPKVLTHEDCLDIMCNRCLKAVREIIPGAQGT